MILYWFSEINSNLNHKYVLICSEKNPKVILGYTSSDYIQETTIFSESFNPILWKDMLAILTIF